jgi:hypothetical protein
MEFFCFHRDREGSADLREDLVEEHWSYMDQFDSQLIVRGPTFDTAGCSTAVSTSSSSQALRRLAPLRSTSRTTRQVPTGTSCDVLDPHAHMGVEVRAWEFGGRRG